MKLTSGVKRLDALLDGGIPGGSAVLVYGPPFLGKETLAHRFFLANLAQGVPGVMVLTNQATGDFRTALTGLDPAYLQQEKKGLAKYVDTYSRSIGADGSIPNAEFLDGALDLNGISLAVNKSQRDFIGTHDQNVLVLDSVSTLIAYSNPQTAFRFLQTLIGRIRRVGATAMFLMDHGMHPEADVQMFKHLMTGVIELKDGGGKPQIKVEGLGAPAGQGWVEYKFSDTEFDITGSFAAGRIR